ncbi:DUF4389 domain-containing protein [Streptomyces sp. BR123]|uniref:DUF4389 domain-containing protein n=1 Tax=Streptomyces sp. BR123 TaxID=2749828 RepID=UPI0015C431F3|nr:DUF4389 domain-containing protein [Streptomyces sp. BR123]NXY96567.1 DUF4389 domain-containing protein [Streptomyces sp. BR123]
MTTGWTPRPPAAASGPEGEYLPELDMPDPGRQRRWTVLLRWLLLIPQMIAVALLGIAAFFVTIVGWFAALFRGRLPEGIARFLGDYLAYATRVTASAMLLVDRYPPFAFAEPGYPVQIELRPGELNRLAVLFRLILMIPAAIVASLLQYGWAAICWVFWLITLVLGRMPQPIFEASAAVLRFRMRFLAYVMMLTSAYPKRLFGDPGPAAPAYGTPPPPTAAPGLPQARTATRPLVLSTGAKVLVVAFLVLGLITGSFSSMGRNDTYYDDEWDAAAHTATRFGTGTGA